MRPVQLLVTHGLVLWVLLMTCHAVTFEDESDGSSAEQPEGRGKFIEIVRYFASWKF